ncbi:hypothetical protein PybrP1_007410 [[Pythium] brassicae (nom. inval.)]|nr:hypothetical protein PybrP1_007410 [[Pythium] brassicae (nom. inval.)]
MTPVNSGNSGANAHALATSGPSSKSKSYLWHLRLGHVGHAGLDMIVKDKLGTGIDIASTPTFGGKRFFVTFIDAKFMEDEFDDGRRVGAQGAVIDFVDDDTNEENDYHEECDEYEESGPGVQQRFEASCLLAVA